MRNLYVIFILICCLKSTAQPTDVFTIARSGTVEQAREITKSNPKAFDASDTRGFTPLILACYRGNNDVAKFIIGLDANINAVSEMGTALMAATVKGNVEIAEVLLRKNANPNLTDSNGTTALMYAVQFKNKDLVSVLVRYNSDKNLADKKGKTAFEYAVFSGDDDIINLLK